MKQVERLTIDGRDVRAFECPACAFTTRLDYGPAVWVNFLSPKEEAESDWDSTLSAEQTPEAAPVELIPHPAKTKQTPATTDQGAGNLPPSQSSAQVSDEAQSGPPSQPATRQRGRSSRSPRKSQGSLPLAGTGDQAVDPTIEPASTEISSDTVSLLVGLDAAAAKRDDVKEEPIGKGIPSFEKGRRPGKKGRLSRVPRSLQVNELVSDVLSDTYVQWEGDKPATTDEIGTLSYMEQGEHFARAGQHARAIQAFTKAIQEQPYHADAYAMRSVALFALRSYYEAIEDASRAVHLDPNLAAAYACRGNCQKMLGRNDLALRDMERARRARLQGLIDACTRMICDNGFDWKAYDERAKIFEQMGENELARDDRERSLLIRGKMWEGQRRPDAAPLFNLSDDARAHAATTSGGPQAVSGADSGIVETASTAEEIPSEQSTGEAPSQTPLSDVAASQTPAAAPAPEESAASEPSIPHAEPEARQSSHDSGAQEQADAPAPAPAESSDGTSDEKADEPAAEEQSGPSEARQGEQPADEPKQEEPGVLQDVKVARESESLAEKLKHADAFESMRQIWLETKGKKNKAADDEDSQPTGSPSD